MPLTTRLRRFNLKVTKDKTSGDASQIPASATVAVYKQGATIKTAFELDPGEFPESGWIEVFDVGGVEAGDTLQIFRDGAFDDGVLTVFGVLGATFLDVRNGSTSTVTGSPGDRLIVTSDRPTVYKEVSGDGSAIYTGSQVDTDSDTGLLPVAYLTQRFFDGIVTDTGTTPLFTPRLLVDQASGHALRAFDLRDFGGDVQLILDLISEGFPAGGIVHIPKGNWPQADTLLIKGGRVIIEGEGWDSRIIGKDANTDVFRILPQPGLSSHAYDIVFRDLMIKGNWGGTPGTGNGISWIGDPEDVGAQLHMDHVSVIECGNDGLHLENVDFPFVLDCNFNTNGRNGAYLLNVAQSTLLGYYANTNQRWGLYLENGGGHLVQATGMEQNHSSVADGVAATDGQLKFKNCGGMVIRSQFESFSQPVAKTAIDLDGAKGVIIEGCGFTTGSDAESVAIRVRATSSGVSIGTNSFNDCGRCIDVSDSTNGPVSISPQDDQEGNLDFISYPTGSSAVGWPGLLSLVPNASALGGFKIPGIRLPFVATPFPASGPENEGTLAYDRSAGRSSRLKLSDGTYWWPIGAAASFSQGPPDNRPSSGLSPGTMIWVPDAPVEQRLQSWDGAAWQFIPISSRTRSIWLPASSWTQVNGTAMTLAGKGTYPNRIVSYAFLDAPASGPQAVGLSVAIPNTYLAGTPVTAKVVWAPASTATHLDAAWMGRLHFKKFTDGMPYDGAEDGVISEVFTYWGNTGAPEPSQAKAVVTQAWSSTIPSSSLGGDATLRMAFDRLTTDPSDNFPQGVEFIGVVLEFTAER